VRRACAEEMRVEEYERMYRLEDRYWWFVGRRAVVSRLLEGRVAPGSRILDVGCGTGATMTTLQEMGAPLGADSAHQALAFCRQRGVGPLLRSDAQSLALAHESVDAVVALDLFEHLAEDVAAMRECWRVCRPGGVLVLTVPAYRFLWSEHDEALHHLRRYRLREVREKLTAAGFRDTQLSYAIVAALLPVAAFRLLQRLFKRAEGPKTSLIELPAFLNAALIWSLRTEAWLLKRFRFPFGVSVVGTARKPAEEPGGGGARELAKRGNGEPGNRREGERRNRRCGEPAPGELRSSCS
jgi:ubiquinone/menaquinone biosynthesis C-methylase UbiE